MKKRRKRLDPNSAQRTFAAAGDAGLMPELITVARGNYARVSLDRLAAVTLASVVSAVTISWCANLIGSMPAAYLGPDQVPATVAGSDLVSPLLAIVSASYARAWHTTRRQPCRWPA